MQGFRDGRGVRDAVRLWELLKRRTESTDVGPVDPAGATASHPEPSSTDPLEQLANSLTQVHPRFIRARPDGSRRLWFTGAEPYFDVFIDRDPDSDALRWFQFTLRGRSVTWNRTHNILETGHTNEFETSLTQYASSKMISPDGHANNDIVALMFEVLNANAHPELLRALAVLADAGRASPNPPPAQASSRRPSVEL